MIFLHGYKAQPSSIAGRRFSWEMLPTEPNMKHFYFHAQTETEKKRFEDIFNTVNYYIIFYRWLAALEYSVDRWMRLS